MRARFLPAFLAAVLSLATSAARGDGGILDQSSGGDVWRVHPEHAQFARLRTLGDREDLTLAVETGSLGGRGVWMFPVPESDASKIQMRISPVFPAMEGVSIGLEARYMMPWLWRLPMLSQLYTPFVMGPRFDGVANALGGEEERGAVVQRHIEQYGLTLELISVSDRVAFEEYLKRKELALPPEARAPLNGYLGERYSLLVAWISGESEAERLANESAEAKRAPKLGDFRDDGSRDEQREHDAKAGRILSVHVSFPSEKLWFPLRMTSMYGKAIVPATLYVCGTAEAVEFERIAGMVQSEPFVSASECPEEDGLFTKLTLESPSDSLTQDLELRRTAGLGVRAERIFIVDHFSVSMVGTFLLLSALSSVLAGWIVYRRQRPRLHLFALLGLANFLTVIGFAIATWASSPGRRMVRDEIRQPGGLLLPVLWAIVVAIPWAVPIVRELDRPAFWFAIQTGEVLRFASQVALVLVPAAMVLWERVTRRPAVVLVAMFSLTVVALSQGLGLLLS